MTTEQTTDRPPDRVLTNPWTRGRQGPPGLRSEPGSEPGSELGADGEPSEWAGWDAYADALSRVQVALATADRTAAAERERLAARAELVRTSAAELDQRHQALTDLAAELDAPLDPSRLTPLADERLPVAQLRVGDESTGEDPWDRGARDQQRLLAAVDAALAEARRVAGLPQLLPQWSSRLARAAVVYAVVAAPSLVLTVLLSAAGVTGNDAVLLWFLVVWPLVTAVTGRLLLGRLGAPRLPHEPSPPRLPRYPWLGVLLAWALWWIPGWALDQLAGLVGR
jgi:hypothetical protein